MFGTIYRMIPKTGKVQAIEELFFREAHERGTPEGAVAGLLLKSRTHPGELVAVAVFSSEDSYRRNADSAEQDAAYRQLRDLLVTDPEWNDGEFAMLSIAEAQHGI